MSGGRSACSSPQHLADHDQMVAAVVAGRVPALEPRRAAVEQRRPPSRARTRPRRSRPPASANRSASPRWPALSTWIAKCEAASKAGKRRDLRAGDQSTSGGASDTLAKLLAVIPSGPRGVIVVTTVTPVAKRPSASRSSLSLNSGKRSPGFRAATGTARG